MSVSVIQSTFIEKHPYFTARKDSFVTSQGKTVDPYYVVELPVSVVAMAITEKKEVLLVRQYRHPVGEYLLELPGGFVDSGEQPHQSILRELQEETGYTFSSHHYLGITAANPGILNNYTHMFIAWGGRKTAEQQLDDNEEIEVLAVPLKDARVMLMHNEVKQSMHALCMFMAFEYLRTVKPEL